MTATSGHLVGGAWERGIGGGRVVAGGRHVGMHGTTPRENRVSKLSIQ